MPSPFPGMDPWLEGGDLFRDLHHSLIFLIREAMNAGLPPGYVAISNHLVWMDAEARREPDVSLFGEDRHTRRGRDGLATLPGFVAVGDLTEPVPWEEPYLEIRADNGARLVTAVEVLSPSNKLKHGEGREAYLEKQKEFRLGGVHSVEIDLLRGGLHTTAVPLVRIRQAAGGPFDYHVGVAIAGPSSYQLHVAPIRLADRLPAIGIPLDPGVPPVTIDLQPLLDRAYDTGRYSQLVRYDQPPDPPLTPEHDTWAAGVLRDKGVLA